MNDHVRTSSGDRLAAWAVLALFVALVIWAINEETKDAKPDVTPNPTFSATVTTVPRMLPADCMVPGVIAAECIEGWSQEDLAAIQCPHEDGKPDGTPCVWIDLDTRTLHYVDSSEYQR